MPWSRHADTERGCVLRQGPFRERPDLSLVHSVASGEIVVQIVLNIHFGPHGQVARIHHVGSAPHVPRDTPAVFGDRPPVEMNFRRSLNLRDSQTPGSRVAMPPPSPGRRASQLCCVEGCELRDSGGWVEMRFGFGILAFTSRPKRRSLNSMGASVSPRCTYRTEATLSVAVTTMQQHQRCRWHWGCRLLLVTTHR